MQKGDKLIAQGGLKTCINYCFQAPEAVSYLLMEIERTKKTPNCIKYDLNVGKPLQVNSGLMSITAGISKTIFLTDIIKFTYNIQFGSGKYFSNFTLLEFK